jgi:hypothetical protein
MNVMSADECESTVYSSSRRFESGRAQLIFLSSATPNVRVKWALVNSVFLVQLRKSLGAEFSRFMEINQAFEDGALTGVWGGSCGGRSEPGGMKFEIPGRILHRACTGNAERRWSVQGSSFPDARFLFLVGVSRSCMRVEEFSLGC